MKVGSGALEGLSGIGLVVSLLVFGLGFALAIWATIRRLRDIKRSIWWVTVLLLPLLLGIVLGTVIVFSGSGITDSVYVKAVGIAYMIVYLLFVGTLLFWPSAFHKEMKPTVISTNRPSTEASKEANETADTYTPALQAGYRMDKLTRMAVIAGVLLAGIGVFYHYVIFLPGVEHDKAAQAVRRQAAYSRCMEQADSIYNADWATACKDVAESAAVELRNCLSDKLIMTNPYMGASYCKRTFAGADPSPECTLPKSRAQSLNAAHKEAQQRCATEARLGVE
jgi:hypothetical protein